MTFYIISVVYLVTIEKFESDNFCKENTVGNTLQGFNSSFMKNYEIYYENFHMKIITKIIRKIIPENYLARHM